MNSDFFSHAGDVIYDLKKETRLKTVYFRALYRRGFEPRVALFYPDKPQIFHVLYDVCHILGCRMTGDIEGKADLAIAFEDRTVRKDYPELERLAKKRKVINAGCRDISKKHVDEVFGKVFGYSSLVDPSKYRGRCVRKSDGNATHDGRIVDCPARPLKGYVYQKLIDNIEDGYAIDYRIPVFGDKIPFVSKRYKSPGDRFDHTIRDEMVKPASCYDKKELIKVIRFCREMGLDYGALDTVRDRKSGRLYIVDANNTPAAPRYPKDMTREGYEEFMRLASRTFASEFLSGRPQS